MSRGISANARPTIFNHGTVRHGRGEVFREIEFVAHSVDPAEDDACWVAMCNAEEPPPEPWIPMRPFSERVVGRPSRCTLPFLGTIRSFCHVPENVDFRVPLEGERADEPPEGFFTLVRAAVEAHRFRFSSSIDNVMEASFDDTSLSTVYAAGRSSGRGSLDAEEDGEPTVEDPIWMD
ncbi:unnamed protein product [Brassica rapa]|uniref:Uncharacterized protein n=1 Tax=Brassica campestris TaxID=3711 RepID=A0A8D9G662_BRACM|nr:unnamed protein product [Brassica rapa]